MVCILLTTARQSSASAYFAYAIFLLVAITGLLLPVSESTGIVEPDKNPINMVNLVIALIVVAGLTSLRFRPVRDIIDIFVIVAAVTNVAHCSMRLHQNTKVESSSALKRCETLLYGNY